MRHALHPSLLPEVLNSTPIDSLQLSLLDYGAQEESEEYIVVNLDVNGSWEEIDREDARVISKRSKKVAEAGRNVTDEST